MYFLEMMLGQLYEVAVKRHSVTHTRGHYYFLNVNLMEAHFTEVDEPASY